jgi:hypothetical protein
MTKKDDKKPASDEPEAGHLWEWAEDVCALCGLHIGWGVRWMHLGLCETCAKKPRH